MSRRVIVLLIIMLSVYLASCGSTSQVSTNEPDAGKTEEVIEGTSLENAMAEGAISKYLLDGTMSTGINDATLVSGTIKFL